MDTCPFENSEYTYPIFSNAYFALLRVTGQYLTNVTPMAFEHAESGCKTCQEKLDKIGLTSLELRILAKHYGTEPLDFENLPVDQSYLLQRAFRRHALAKLTDNGHRVFATLA